MKVNTIWRNNGGRYNMEVKHWMEEYNLEEKQNAMIKIWRKKKN